MAYFFPIPRQRRIDPLQKRRGPAFPLGDNFDEWRDALHKELNDASLQQLAAVALRFLEIANPALETSAAARNNLYLNIYWDRVPAVYEAIKNAPTEEAARQVDAYEIFGPPSETHDLQREVEAWIPNDILYYEEATGWLTVRKQVLLIYFQVLQILTRQARYYDIDPKLKLEHTIFVSAMWLALIPAALHPWPEPLQRQFLWPDLETQIDEPDRDLSDITDNIDTAEYVAAMHDSGFGNLWLQGLKKVWREINGTIPFRA